MRPGFGDRLIAWLRRLLGLAPRRGPRGARMLALSRRPTTRDARARAQARLPPNSRRQITTVRPREADPAITRFLQDHVVVTYPGQTGPSQAGDRLVVFFPGTFAFPAGFMHFLDTAAACVGRAIGLDYVDAVAPGEGSVRQASGNDPSLAGAVRQARVFGGMEPSGEVIAPADSIVSRLVTLLAHLHTLQPQAGWSNFLDGAQPRWSRLILAGHSQGAGMAAYLARIRHVSRVVLISGGADGDPHTREAAEWVLRPSATPLDHWYAMLHAGEPHVQGTLLGLQALGVPGPSTHWAGPGSLGASHIALVDAPSRTKGLHESTAADNATPLEADGRPIYAAPWRAMLTG